MNRITLIFLAFTALFFQQCTQTETLEPDTPINTSIDCAENEAACDLVTTINDFGFDVFQKLHESKKDENSFISPLSISTALSMVLNGADTDTKTAIQSTLNLKDWQLDEINKAYLALLTQLPGLDEKVKLQIANSIWYKEGFDVLPSFLDVNSKFFNSEIQELDFLKPDAVEEINSWVEDKTEGLIDKILDEIPAEAVMYLINAIYFKGDWTHTFDGEFNYESNFFITESEQEKVEYMSRGKAHLAYLENDLFQAINLPYGDSLYAMSIFLPKPEQNIDDVIAALNTENWTAWNTAYETTEVLFSMPKFELKYEKRLNQILMDLGMDIAFSDKADFSKINGKGGLTISEVRHKSFIKVDEQGTEAAAVTIIGIETTSVPSYPIMEVNRPFVFVIRDHQTNSALFVGKVVNPNAG
ncbi:MAG: serpin family protein [Bacteroidota bacterium]